MSRSDANAAATDTEAKGTDSLSPRKRWYDVTLTWADGPHRLFAESPSQARYMSWRAASEAGYYDYPGGIVAFGRDSRVRLSSAL